MAYTDLTGLAGSTLALIALVLLFPGVARLQPKYRIWLVILVAAASLIPCAGLPIAAYLRAVIGDLSITTLTLLILAIRQEMAYGRPADDRHGQALYALIALLALGLYPLALGVGYFDPYRLGYGNPWLIGVLLAVALAACWLRWTLVALCPALAVLAWAVGWYESTNVWDYLLDPLLAIYAIGAVIRLGLRMRKPRGWLSPRR
ncbi:MAG: hypothetical protein V4443_03385 [Pseudomonadota bacterium]